MIDGDIDLTEDLDFYHDRKLPSYHNVDLSEKEAMTNDGLRSQWNHIVWNNESQVIATTSISTTSTLNNRIYYNNDFLSQTVSEYYYENTWNSLSYTTSYFEDEPIFVQNNNGTTTTLRISYSPGLISIEDYKSSAQKLFGDRAEWVEIRHIEDIFGKRKQPEYHNTKDFDTLETIHISMSGWYSRHDREPTSAEELFGTREDPYIDEPMIPIPWLEHMSMSEYRDYIDEISGNEKDYSKYLTDYGWLRMH